MRTSSWCRWCAAAKFMPQVEAYARDVLPRMRG
jgi:hypothetical protein